MKERTVDVVNAIKEALSSTVNMSFKAGVVREGSNTHMNVFLARRRSVVFMTLDRMSGSMKKIVNSRLIALKGGSISIQEEK